MLQQKSIRKVLCLALGLLLIYMASISAFASSYAGIEVESEWEILKIVNQERISAGLDPLSMTSALQDASHTRVEELGEKYSSTRPNGESCYTVLSDASITYSRAAENIMSGQSTAESAIATWMNNKLYRENILGTNYQHIGVGYSYSSEASLDYWQLFFIGSTDNSFSNAKIYRDNSDSLPINTHTTITDMDIVLECTSSIYGTCFLPVLDEMCTGFNPSNAGSQTITVTYKELTATFTLSIVKPDQDAPTNLRGYAPSEEGLNDGKITGTSTIMEYRHEDEIYYTTCTGDTIENLESGIYYVRYRETTALNASAEVKVIIPTGGTESHFSYLNGYTDGSFGPNRQMTRAEAAAMFYNLMDDQSVNTTASFSDVKETAWYADAVSALAEQKIISGYIDGTFRPNDSITRAEFLIMAVAFSGVEQRTAEIPFTDVVEGWYYASLQTAFANGWTTGYTDGTFRPYDAITRGEVATMANKMLERDPDVETIKANPNLLKTFTDLDSSHWAYYAIVEASTSHSALKTSDGEVWVDFL